MEIRVDDREASLADVDNLGELKVIVPGFVTAGALGSSLAACGVGVLDDGMNHVFVESRWLRETGRVLTKLPDWLARFDAMVCYAGEHGWLDGEGRIRAHIDRTQG